MQKLNGKHLWNQGGLAMDCYGRLWSNQNPGTAAYFDSQTCNVIPCTYYYIPFKLFDGIEVENILLDNIVCFGNRRIKNLINSTGYVP